MLKHSAGFYHHCTINSTNLHGGTYTLRKFFNTHFPILFPKTFSKIILGPFWGSQGPLPTIFEFPFSRYVSPYFFRRFHIFSHFLLQGIETSDEYWTSWWYISYTLPNFFQNYLGRFWGPKRSSSVFFNSPSTQRIPIFSWRFDLISHFFLQGIETPDDYWT